MTRDEVLQVMGESVRDFCEPADAMLVHKALTEQPERMLAYLNADKRTWSQGEFAAFALRCAKRVLAGGES